MLTSVSKYCDSPLDTGHDLSAHKTFKRRPRLLLNIIFTFDVHPVSGGDLYKFFRSMEKCHEKNLFTFISLGDEGMGATE